MSSEGDAGVTLRSDEESTLTKRIRIIAPKRRRRVNNAKKREKQRGRDGDRSENSPRDRHPRPEREHERGGRGFASSSPARVNRRAKNVLPKFTHDKKA